MYSKRLSGKLVCAYRNAPAAILCSIYSQFIITIIRISTDLYPRMESRTIDVVDHQLNDSRFMLSELINMLDRRSVERHYENAMKGLCEGTLLGLTIMTIAALATAFLLTLLVCVDSHTWIYLSHK